MAQAESDNTTTTPADEKRTIGDLVYDLEDFITRTEGFADAAVEIACRAPNGDRAGSGLIAITGSMVTELKAMREHFDLMIEEVRGVERAKPPRDTDAKSKEGRVTAFDLYDDIEDDLRAAISIATFLSQALDSVPDLDKKDAQGAGRVVGTIYDLLDGIKGKCLNAMPPPIVSFW